MRGHRWSARSPQAGLGCLPQVDQPVESVHEEVHLLGARARPGRHLQLLADAGHLAPALFGAFGSDAVEELEDLLSGALIVRYLPEIAGEVLSLSAHLPEGIHERWRPAARCVGLDHASFNYTRNRAPTGPLPELPAPSSFALHAGIAPRVDRRPDRGRSRARRGAPPRHPTAHGRRAERRSVFLGLGAAPDLPAPGPGRGVRPDV